MRGFAGILGMFLALCAVAQAADFPDMTVTTMAGDELVLPGDFGSKPTILVLVYDQNQQAQADSWMPFLDAAGGEQGDGDYFLMPLLPAGLSIVRGLVEGAIRDSAGDPSQLERTILLFTDVAGLQAALGIERTDAIHVVVIGAEGEVRMSVTGPYSAEGGQMVSAALALSPAVPLPACHQTTFGDTGR